MPRLILGGIGIAPALFIGGYKGVLFSATAQADWKDSRWLGAELATSAGLLGVAGLLLTAILLPAAVEGMRRAQIALLMINFAFAIHLFFHLTSRPLREIQPGAHRGVCAPSDNRLVRTARAEFHRRDDGVGGGLSDCAGCIPVAA